MNQQDIDKLIEENEGYVSTIRELQQQNEGHVRQINTAKEGIRWFLEVWDKDPDCDCKRKLQVNGRYCDWCEGIDKLNTTYTILNGGIEHKQ